MKQTRFYSLVILLFSFHAVTGQQVFSPEFDKLKIVITQSPGKITVDGKLNEAIWQQVKPISNFKEVEPYQGNAAVYDTEVKIIQDNNYIYLGVFARDKNCKENIRVPDLKRDFSFDDNDLFGVSIDALNTRRNAVAFQVTPYETQRDLQSFDDVIFDVDWDALWYAKTHITDSGWYAEIALPFQSIRYSPTNTSWGLNFIRIHRASNEITAWPGYPRSFDTYRMTYAAELTSIQLPRPGVNIRLNPYFLEQLDNQKGSNKTNTSNKVKPGGEIKWAISENAAIDVTFNTDFAQADVDRQVVNLTRFSVYFPERRQFFLENSGLFAVGDEDNIEPFFSRRIGLDNDGKQIPLLTGARYTSRNKKRSIGAIYSLQNDTDTLPKTHFSVFRYALNYGEASNAGIMITNKFSGSNSNNTVAALSGVHRFGEKWRIKYLWSNSFDKSGSTAATGSGANLNLDYTSNRLFLFSNHSLISEDYKPGIGFVSRENLLIHSTGIIPVFRPSWKPKFVRSIQPGVIINAAQRLSDLSMQEGSLDIWPIYIYFNDGSRIDFRYQLAWQILTADFNLVDAVVSSGRYSFNSYKIRYNSDLSRRFSFTGSIETGGYYNGRLHALSAELKIAPSRYISFINNYEFNRLCSIGVSNQSFDTHLFTSSVRLALNANIQLAGFYQYNSTLNTGRLNLRFSWQYRPLSFIYLVFNSQRNTDLKTTEQQGIFKINFLRQLN